MNVNEIPNRIFHKDGEEYLYFGGANYLGVNTLPEFQAIAFESLKKWGTSYGSSRLANIQLEVYNTAEEILAKQIGTEAAVTVSSGMLAGKLALELLHKTTDLVFHFPNTHPALLNTFSLPLLINEQLNPLLFDCTISKIGIVADAIPSLQVTPIDLSILLDIPSDKEIILVLDESHSLGLLGDNGEGLLNKFQIPNVNQKICIASLGKAIGLSGGVIAGNLSFITELKQLQSFVGASGMNPAFLETFVNAQELYRLQRQSIKNNLKYVAENLIPNLAFTFSKDYPVLYFDNEEVLQMLLENNIVPTSFPYPTSSGKLSRIVISAHHTFEDLDKMIDQLNVFSKLTNNSKGVISYVL